MAKQPAPTPEGFVRVGQIVGAHGLKGQVKVVPLTNLVQRFAPGARLRMQEKWVEIRDAQWHKERLLIRLFGYDDRTAAEGLQWEYLEAPDQAPEMDEDEYLTEDLLGLDVYTEEGELLGVVEEVLMNPAHDVIVVGDIMIPGVKEFVKMIDFDENRITVHLIPGMRGEE
jgi:16S rRNA processing protein RimM